MPGGGRAFSKNPYLYFPHCHPIKNFSCTKLEIIATRILKTFKTYIDCTRWTSPILVGVSKLVSDNHNDITLPGKYTEYDAKIQHDNNWDMTLSRKYAVDDTQKMRELIQDIYQSPFTPSIYSQKNYTNKRNNLSDIVDYACVERQIEMSTGLIMGMAMIYSNFGETEETLVVLSELKTVIQEASDAFSRFSSLQLKVASAQPDISPALAKLVIESKERVEARIPA